MSSKPTRVRKLANRNPTLLALLLAIPVPDVPVLDPFSQIDLQLTNIDIDVDIDTTVNLVYSPFSDARVILSPTSANILFESFEAVDNLQPANTIQVLQATKKGFTWLFIIEQMLFNKLLSQANNRKQADNRFKKKVWTAACTAVKTVTTQLATVEQCKGKAEAMKALWKEFI
jgi:hypothetical protein